MATGVSRHNGRTPRRGSMKGNRLRTLALGIIAVTGIVAFGVQRAAAQVPGGGVKLWVDQRTGQVFVRPGSGRVPLSLTTADSAAIEQQIEQKIETKTNQQIKAQVEQSAAQLQESDAARAEQVTDTAHDSA